MINLVSIVKPNGKTCAKCRNKFYKMRTNLWLCNKPGADAIELQKVDDEEHCSSHEGDADASDVATENTKQ